MASWGVEHVRAPARTRQRCLACGGHYEATFPARTLPRCRRCVTTAKPVDRALMR
jgi:hypothetical protein